MIDFSISLPVAVRLPNIGGTSACSVTCTKARATALADFFFPSLFSECSMGGVEQAPKRAQRGTPHRAGVRARLGCSTTGPVDHTGHSSSFHAISQNIHSYRELITNDSSIRRFSVCPACLAHWSTFLRIHRCTSANSGEAYSISQSR